MAENPNVAILVVIVVIVVSVLSIPPPFEKKEGNMAFRKRHARNLYQFGIMITCSTNRSMWDYYDYGCWCGFGGSGTPVDGTDRCCYLHDLCYDMLINKTICSSPWSTYYSFYRYTGCRQCEPESKYPPDDQQKACRKALCECDSEAAKCFAEKDFHTSYIDYDTSRC